MGKDADCCDACRQYGDPTTEPPPVTTQRPHARCDEVKLVVASRGGVAREVLPQGPRMPLGRGRNADLQIDDSALSRIQCVFTCDERGVFVADAKSTCGTYVDGRLIHGPFELHVGARIDFGNTIVRVERR
jgi:predicted component of type VI protein secretion system